MNRHPSHLSQYRISEIRNPDAPFLFTPSRVYTYGDLLDYTQNLWASSAYQRVIIPDITPESLFTLAAHFLLSRPVVISSKEVGDEALQAITQSESGKQNSPVMAWIFTSGTMSHAKCVPVQLLQIQAAAQSAQTLFAPDPGKAWLLNLPLYHVGGLSVLYRSLLWQSAIYLPSSRESSVTADLLANETRIQTISLVYTQWKRMVEAGLIPHTEMKAILLGGGPVPENFIRNVKRQSESTQERLSLPPLYNSYGMTETFAMIACRDLRISDTKGNVGFVMGENKARVNPSGEIELFGPQIFDGYASDKEYASEKESDLNELPESLPPATPFTADGWFKTGDYGRIEDDGSLTILSRRSDLIVSGGKNILPTDVESALMELAYVHEAAVTALEDEEWGEVVVALLILKEGLDEIPSDLLKEVRADLRNSLESYQIPKRILQVHHLPKTDLGKLRRNELRQLASSLVLNQRS